MIRNDQIQKQFAVNINQFHQSLLLNNKVKKIER